MTDDRDFKALVRARMRATGENYTSARAALRPDEPAYRPRAARGEDPQADVSLVDVGHVDDSHGDGYAAALAQQHRLVARFFDGPRLRWIPAKRKPRVAVLLHLLQRFEPGREYSEPEVNEVLGQAHEDYAWLRRELVDYRYLQREHGRYRVVAEPPHRHGFEVQEVPAWESHWLPGFLAGAREATRVPPAAT